ncbi:hypothetical protein ABIA24_000034 [Sinorhizobium fredii]
MASDFCIGGLPHPNSLPAGGDRDLRARRPSLRSACGEKVAGTPEERAAKPDPISADINI